MCGIAGILGGGERPVKLDELRAMSGMLVHRGPDDDGYYLDASVGLTMRRLSIIDLESGRQPVRNEDGSVWVVFNGEIYNYRQLRRELQARGHTFVTTTDTEVIVHLYEDLGPNCVDELRGMFAFALWDAEKRQLLIARDRLGIKPLYYAEIAGRLYFGSELKALLALPDVERQLDWSALGHLLTCQVTPSAHSIVAGSKKSSSSYAAAQAASARTGTSASWSTSELGPPSAVSPQPRIAASVPGVHRSGSSSPTTRVSS